MSHINLSTLSDKRKVAPAADRNKEPILEVLQRVLPPSGFVLEVASGTGQHAAHFAPQLKPRLWLPSDPSLPACESIRAWAAHCPSDNLLPPLVLDASVAEWPEQVQEALGPTGGASVSGIVNMVHIAPWACCLGLMRGAGQLLQRGGVLVLYGPFLRAGVETAPSNLAFDASLRAQDPALGLRQLEDVAAVASGQGLRLGEVVDMPANNVIAVFHKL